MLQTLSAAQMARASAGPTRTASRYASLRSGPGSDMSSETQSTSRATRVPNACRTSGSVTGVSSTTSCRSPAASTSSP